MSRLEALTPASWKDLVDSPAAVLILGKSDCDNCARWSEELTEWLTSGDPWPNVRFGKLMLDTPGLVAFKRANPWVAQLEMLPHTVIYRDGEKVKEFAGGGVERLDSRLRRLFDAASE